MNRNFTAAAIVLAILFCAAFQCGKEEGGRSSTKNNPSSDSPVEKNNPVSGKLTEAIVKRLITEGQETAISTTGPNSIDVTFESIKFGKPETPSKQDEIDGIRSDIYYPVRVKYTVIQHYTDSDREIKWYEDCKFYINSYSEWAYTFTKAG